MPSIQQLKQRIKSVQSTSQLTKAMQAVAALRFRRYQNLSKSAQSYFSQVKDLNSLALASFSNLKDNKFFGKPKNGKTLMVIVSPTRGFCGGLHRLVTLKAYKYLEDLGLKTTDSDQVNFITINKPGYKQASRLGGEILAAFNELSKAPDSLEMLAVSETIFRFFKDPKENFSTVYLSFVDESGSVQIQQLLPFSGVQESNVPTVIDMDEDKFLEELVHQYLHAQLFAALTSTQLSEERSRMVAMNQATDNAKKLTATLQLTYFRARQTKITQEMNEISSNLV